MRIIRNIVIAFVVIVMLTILWLWRGRDLTMFVDRFRTIEIGSRPIKRIIYEGSGTGGVLYLNDLMLGLNPADPSGSQLNIGTTKDNQLALSFAGKVFPFGPLRLASDSENLGTDVPVSDHATIGIRHSAIPWPTPFDFNFMTGQSPSWRRYVYYQLDWQKPDQAQLEMVWRYEEYFYSSNGWVNSGMSYEKFSGLIRIEIHN